MSIPRITTRRLMTLVALSAVALCGVHGSPRPGWHVRLPLSGVSVGACRDDRGGPLLGPHGREIGWTYEVGIWRDDGPGAIVAGLRVRGAWAVLFWGEGSNCVVY